MKTLSTMNAKLLEHPDLNITRLALQSPLPVFTRSRNGYLCRSELKVF